ncbi:MAG: hypothetical protein J7J91_10060 [Deltaproteobacteria bacterium]|nr:hypothetical protein [Deltaproteobacteria bacterium]
MRKVIRNFLKKDSFGYGETKIVKMGPSDHLKVVITSGGFIHGGAVYRVKERERSSAILELVGTMPIEEIREYNLKKQVGSKINQILQRRYK